MMQPTNPAPSRKDIFLAAARGERPARVPVWIMRQAGRYLPGYRRIRERFSFLEVAKTPELAAEVSLEPYQRIGVDAIIVFSDILIVAEAMGLGLEILDDGPKLGNPVRDRAAVERLREFDAERATGFVGHAIRATGNEAGPSVPVLGFAAAPWTLACYMVEGRTRGELAVIKSMMYSEPEVLRELLAKIAHATAGYLKMQIAAGATAVQVFDTWAGELGRKDYEEFALPATQQLISEVRAGNTPVIHYAKNCAHLLGALARTGATVLSVDWRTDLAEARTELRGRIALQGNVDPTVLLGPEEGIRNAVREAIGKTGGAGHILNLGHGILPQTSVENAQVFVNAARECSENRERRTETAKVTGRD
ncbi:MAG TPA: uroporphyrinogen decarboxylase [Candidatus Acidoferrales bacterium]|nr:uroporphyrinogen decarboxylase [Candidatus Acidoferrales bacterium]